MWGLLKLIIGFIVIYYSFAGLAYAMPTVSPGLYEPYQLWFFVLYFFYIILPSTIGDYIYNIRLEEG